MFKIILITLFLLVSCTAFAVDPTLNWQSTETDHFYIHFAEGNQALAKKAANIAESVHNKLSPIIDWMPSDKTHLVLSDESDQSNGLATAFPFNRSILFISPPDTTNTLEDYADWLETLITHEYTHILHLDKNIGAASRLRKIFGRYLFLFPNVFQPGWLVEGFATYHETDKERGVGRGQSSLYKMMMRMEVANGIKPVDQVNLRVRSWPVGVTPYLYGVHFYQFIENVYGQPAVKALIDNYSNNIVPFAINSNAETVLGKDITELWEEFEHWLNKEYQPQLKKIEQDGVIAGKAITQTGYFTRDVQAIDNEQVYYLRQGAFKYPALMRINAVGEHQEIIEIHRGTRMDVHKNKGVLLAQLEYCDEYNRYYDLYIVEHDQQELKRITECGRYRSASWSADGSQIIAVHTDKGISQLHILNAQGKKQSVVWQGKDNEVIAQPDWSPDGRYIAAAVFRSESGWNIELFDLKIKQWKKITDDQFIDMQPEFNESGESLVFSSDRDDIYNIYQYELKQKKLTQLTRVKDGAFQPSQLNKHSPLYYVGYSANGTNIMKLNNVSNIAELEISPGKAKKNIKAAYREVETTKEKNYSPWSSLTPRWWFPYFITNNNQTEIGFNTAGSDALDIHNYFLQAAYDTKNLYPVGRINYSYSNRLQMGIDRSTDIFLTTNGNFDRARKDDSAFIAYMFPNTHEKYRWNFLVAAFTRKTSDARLATGQLPATDFKDNLVGAAITFSNPRYYTRSISANDGRSVNVVAESSDIINSDFSGEIYTLDWREYLSLGGEHVLALRLAEGYGTKQPEPFRLGGEENNFAALDILLNTVGGEPLFGRREYGLRGYGEGLPQLRGRRMQLASMEWRFPLDLVERSYMSPPIGLVQYSGSLFADTGSAWQAGSQPDKYYTGVGLELHADMNLFYGVNLRIRLGVAKGLDSIIGDERAYFSLGASF